MDCRPPVLFIIPLTFVESLRSAAFQWLPLQNKLNAMMGILGSGLCYVGMSWCVEQRGPVFTSAFTPSMPIYVTMMDFAFFHEQII
ncbi:hypothetical protein BVRB_8g193110 [Beta vulgaris subsp. vulgaris]|nr:hypothetical protein BVRB_8g193110 [Beta vulgaris subsp. vulgaris]